MSTATLLVELLDRGTAAEGAAEPGRRVCDGAGGRACASAIFCCREATATGYATPRRLAVSITHVPRSRAGQAVQGS